MPIFAESQEKIYGDIINDLVNDTNITRTSPGSKTRALIEALSKKLGRMFSVFDLNFGQAFLNGADGKWLDFIGDMMGLPRLGENAAVITALDRNVRFYVDVGTFGSINGGSPITIPKGRIISTQSDGAGIRYRTTISTVLDASADEGFVSVQSVRTGLGQNISKNQLRYHDITSYTDYQNDSLKVTNDADVTLAANMEIDENYRFRIANQVTSSEKANEVAIRVAALSVPGVADITYLPYHRGIGTFDLLLKSTTPTVSDGLLAAVNSSVAGVTSAGNVPRTRKPVEVGLALVATLQYRRQLAAQEETSIIQAVTSNLTNYTNSLDIAEDFVVQEALERVLSTSDLIKKVGETTKPFDNLYTYKPSRMEDNKVRSTLLDDYVPASDERVIVENRYAGSTPILVRSA